MLCFRYSTTAQGDEHDGAAGVGTAGVRPGATRLLIEIEYSRVRDRSWMYPTSLVTTRIGIELAAVQGNYPTVL